MFQITFEDETNKQWHCEYVFDSFDDAKEYLKNRGFTERNRLFERFGYNWVYYTLAYISPLKTWNKTLDKRQ